MDIRCQDKEMWGNGSQASFLQGTNEKGWFVTVNKLKLGELEAELTEMNLNTEKLKRTYNELLEYKFILQKLKVVLQLSRENLRLINLVMEPLTVRCYWSKK